jgi:hypothetical protein
MNNAIFQTLQFLACEIKYMLMPPGGYTVSQTQSDSAFFEGRMAYTDLVYFLLGISPASEY